MLPVLEGNPGFLGAGVEEDGEAAAAEILTIHPHHTQVEKRTQVIHKGDGNLVSGVELLEVRLQVMQLVVCGIDRRNLYRGRAHGLVEEEIQVEILLLGAVLVPRQVPDTRALGLDQLPEDKTSLIDHTGLGCIWTKLS